MKKSNKAILLQAAYLKTDTLAGYLINSRPKSIDDMLSALTKKLGKDKPFKLPTSNYHAITSVSEGLSFLLMKECNIFLETLYDCFSDEEISKYLEHDYMFTECNDSFSFRFILEIKDSYDSIKKCRWVKDQGIYIDKKEIIGDKTFCYVTILKSDLGKYALEIIDDNPLMIIN